MGKSFVFFIMIILFFSACGTKNIYQSTDDLSRRFGVKITQKENVRLYSTSSKWLGTPYKMGGTTKNGVDCSGFVIAVYKDVYGKNLSRSSAEMFKKDAVKIERSSLREGDLVFFRTDGGSKKNPNHVGIYLKDGKFVHASTSKGVMINSLDETYYKNAWISGGRVK
ncbi:MAG: C40 family peptidase [Campylobacteraceae bacterium]|nr:C40 family peptidase [Campylobacteraceae bacterium]